MNKIRQFFMTSGGMNATSSVLAVLAGLLAGFIILLASNSAQAGEGFLKIVTGGFSNMYDVGMVLSYATPIVLTGLSVGFAGKTGLFNIGASGQFTFGMFSAIVVAVHCSFLPDALRCIAALLAGVLAGAIWGMIPGMLKAWRNVHEVISCIMMNFIGMYLVNYLIKEVGVYDQLRNFTTRVPKSAELPRLGMDSLFSTTTENGALRLSSAGSGILIAIAACIILYIVLEKTKFGYELKSCGFNRDAARYAGVNENRGIIMSMVIAGGMAGLGGAVVALSGTGTGIQVVDVLAPEGFMGIPVALLGLNNPIGIVFSGLLVAHLTQGGFLLQRLNFAPEIIEIIIAVIIYFSALALLFKGAVTFIMRERKKKELSHSEIAPADPLLDVESEKTSDFEGGTGPDLQSPEANGAAADKEDA